MTDLSRIGLGAVQFGMHYGVSNRAGRPEERAVAAILDRAVAQGVGYLDTAPAYGDAEVLLGRHLPASHGLRIVTKMPGVPDARVEARHKQQWLDTLALSLDRLKVSTVYGLLVHQARDLDKPGWQYLVEALQEAQRRGLVSRIGVSVYDETQLRLAGSRFRSELVQLPLNTLDRRLIESGALARLKARGIEVHARSVFLQGLLLTLPQDLPDFFRPLRQRLTELRGGWGRRGLSPLAACLAFVLGRKEVDAAIVGVNSLAEFEEIASAVAEINDAETECDVMLPVDPIFLDPSRWPTLVH